MPPTYKTNNARFLLGIMSCNNYALICTCNFFPHQYKGVVVSNWFFWLWFVGYLKSWASTTDLVSVLKNEIRDGQLSFRGKRVLEVTWHAIRTWYGPSFPHFSNAHNVSYIFMRLYFSVMLVVLLFTNNFFT